MSSPPSGPAPLKVSPTAIEIKSDGMVEKP
jgi:hypothetical protein